jgi:transcriptional repressor NrdR
MNTTSAKNPADRGLHCAHCGGHRSKVINTRPKPGGRIVRRRECTACGKRFTTWEKPASQV